MSRLTVATGAGTDDVELTNLRGNTPPSRSPRRGSHDSGRGNAEIGFSAAEDARQRSEMAQRTLRGRNRRASYAPPVSPSAEFLPRLPTHEPWSAVPSGASSSSAAAGAAGAATGGAARTGRSGTHEDAGAISNQLLKRGNMEDATTQVDSRYFFEALPSERRLMQHEAYQARYNLETAQPYTGAERSVTRELREMERVSSHPTLREMRTLSRQGTSLNMSNFKMMVGRRARLRKAEERAKMGFWGRRRDDLMTMWDRAQRYARKRLVTVWTRQMRYIEQAFGHAYACYFDFSRLLLYLNLLICVVVVSLVLAEGIVGRDWGNSNVDYIPYLPLNTSSQSSFFYYSGYTKTMVYDTYLMDLAYFCMIVLVYMISFFYVVKNLRNHLMMQYDSAGDQRAVGHPYTIALFTTFDFSVISESGVAAMRNAVTKNVREMIEGERLQEKVANIYKGANFVRIVVARLIGNLLVLLLMGGAGYLIYYSTKRIPAIETNFGSIRPTSFLISGSNVVLPIIFGYIGMFEMYETQLIAARVHLTRSYVIKIASIYVMLLSYLSYVAEGAADVPPSARNWETNIGQDFYNLAWINGVLSILSPLFTAWGMELWVYYSSKGKQSRGYTFSLSDNILELIYTQVITWMGVVYAPIVPVITVFFAFIIFHVNFYVLIRFGRNPDELLSAARTSTFFMQVLLLTLVVAGVPVAYALTTMRPSVGPWLSLPYAYQVIPNYINQTPLAVQTVMSFIASATFLVPVVVLLVVIVYLLNAYNQRRRDRIAELEQDLAAEREDKRYLLRFYRVQL